MLENITLGIIQGITEWLPISSGAALLWVSVNIFGSEAVLKEQITHILFLHLGTFLAAIVYFRTEVAELTKSLFKYKKSEINTKKVLKFLIISSVISGVIAGVMLALIKEAEGKFVLQTKGINVLVVILLVITAIVNLTVKKKGVRKEGNLDLKDSVWAGFAQGISVLPGLSRSGLTTATLLLRKLDDVVSLRLSFIMSLPIVLVGNIILNINASFELENLWGLVFSFIFGILTIHMLLKVAKKINFGKFVLFFAVLVLISTFI